MLVTMITAAPMRALRLRPSAIRPGAPLRPTRVCARRTSTTSEAATNARSAGTRAKNLVYGSLLTFGLGFGYLYITDTRASVHEWLVVSALRQIYPDGEDAHHAGTAILKALYKFGLHPRERNSPDLAGDLEVEVFGHTLSNPIGTSAGIDKGAEVPTQLLALGPAIVEVGAVTPLPQPGNPKPRVFRLPSQNALINRYGFNSEGAEVVAMRLRQRVREFAYHLGLGLGEDAERAVLNGEAGVPPGSLIPGRLMAVQVTKNKTTSENDIEAVVKDYATGVKHLGKYADIIVVNVSSPNTPGLRTLQNVEPLTRLLNGVVQAVNQVDRNTRPAIMVKVSPDEDTDEQVAGICEAVWESGVNGIIVGNTTKKRPDPLPKGYVLPKKEADILLEQGGYSGPQMFERTLALTKKYRKALDAGPRHYMDSGSHERGKKPEVPETEQKESPSESPAPLRISSPLAEQPSTLASSPPFASSAGHQRKVLFATGGITNGRQAKEILDAGASVAMVYTALIYGGVGTITRIKEELREEKKKP